MAIRRLKSREIAVDKIDLSALPPFVEISTFVCFSIWDVAEVPATVSGVSGAQTWVRGNRVPLADGPSRPGPSRPTPCELDCVQRNPQRKTEVKQARSPGVQKSLFCLNHL